MLGGAGVIGVLPFPPQLTLPTLITGTGSRVARIKPQAYAVSSALLAVLYTMAHSQVVVRNAASSPEVAECNDRLFVAEHAILPCTHSLWVLCALVECLVFDDDASAMTIFRSCSPMRRIQLRSRCIFHAGGAPAADLKSCRKKALWPH